MDKCLEYGKTSFRNVYRLYKIDLIDFFQLIFLNQQTIFCGFYDNLRKFKELNLFFIKIRSPQSVTLLPIIYLSLQKMLMILKIQQIQRIYFSTKYMSTGETFIKNNSLKTSHSWKYAQFIKKRCPLEQFPFRHYFSNYWVQQFSFMQQNFPKIYTAILFLPAIGFFIPNQTISEHASFLIVLTAIIIAFLCHLSNSKYQFLNQIRKCLACLATATLVLFLSAEISSILITVYKVDFSEEISFAVKMILLLSNMEGNLELCTAETHKKQSQTEPFSHPI